MIDGINEEKTSTERTAASFDSIQENTLSIRDHVELLTRNMEELKNANYLIADSTQTISAVSEEVSAHAAETMTAEERNEELLGQIHGKMPWRTVGRIIQYSAGCRALLLTVPNPAYGHGFRTMARNW